MQPFWSHLRATRADAQPVQGFPLVRVQGRTAPGGARGEAPFSEESKRGTLRLSRFALPCRARPMSNTSKQNLGEWTRLEMTDRAGAVRFSVHVRPRSSRCSILGVRDGA